MTFSSVALIVASLTRFTRSPRRRFRYRVLVIRSREKTTSMNRVWTWRSHATCFNSSRASQLTEGGAGRKRKRNDSPLTSRPDYLFFFLDSTKRNVFANNRGQDDGKEPGLFVSERSHRQKDVQLVFLATTWGHYRRAAVATSLYFASDKLSSASWMRTTKRTRRARNTIVNLFRRR